MEKILDRAAPGIKRRSAGFIRNLIPVVRLCNGGSKCEKPHSLAKAGFNVHLPKEA
ncbi:MAG: hypothetical protein H7301_02645 [Cryobacterium sp.]|nr:hypothetical protein [Oligoflexia bacterium]